MQDCSAQYTMTCTNVSVLLTASINARLNSLACNSCWICMGIDTGTSCHTCDVDAMYICFPLAI